MAIIRICLVLGIIGLCSVGTVWACHTGGPMGFASGDAGMLSIDITYSPTLTFASTSGTSGCKNWDFAQHRKASQQKYVLVKWEQLSEEAARGEGPHLEAFLQIMGCDSQYYPTFADVLSQHYSSLFFMSSEQSSTQRSQQFLSHVERLIADQETLREVCVSAS